MLESEQRFCRRSGRKSRQFVLQRLKLSHGFDGRVFIGRNLGWGMQVGLSSDWLVLRWQGSVSGISLISLLALTNLGSTCLSFSLKLPSSLGGTFGPIEELRRHLSDGSVHPLEEERDPAVLPHQSFLDCPPLVSAFLTSLLGNLTESALGIQGRSRRLKSFSTNKKHRTQKGFWYPGGLWWVSCVWL